MIQGDDLQVRGKEIGDTPYYPSADQVYFSFMINGTELRMDDEQLQHALPVRDPNPAREQLRDCLLATLQGKSALEAVTITSDLISYLRDQVLNNLGAVRRNAAARLKESGMTTDEIAQATGMTPVTVRRLVTESKY